MDTQENQCQEFHKSLQVEQFKTEKGFTEYRYKQPFALSAQAKAAYESIGGKGSGLWRKWNPESKTWTCNKNWIQIMDRLARGDTLGLPPAGPAAPKLKNPHEAASDALDAVTAAIEVFEKLGDTNRVKAFTEAKNWIGSVRS